jgi:hypothetical protein
LSVLKILTPGADLTMKMLNNNKIRTDNGGHDRLKASVTVETAFSFPLFFFFLWMLWQLFLVILLEMNVTRKVMTSAQEFSAVGYINRTISGKKCNDESIVLNGLIYGNLFESLNVFDEGLRVECKRSGDDDYIIEVIMDHPLVAPFFKKVSLPLKFSYKIRENTGVWDDNRLIAKKEVKDEKKEKKEKVYITESGSVYHRDPGCCYLSVKAQSLKESELKDKRNRDGKRYTECKYCKDSVHTGEVYITYYGTKFHYGSDCSMLKRSVREADLSEIKGMSPCSKCGGNNEQ